MLKNVNFVPKMHFTENIYVTMIANVITKRGLLMLFAASLSLSCVAQSDSRVLEFFKAKINSLVSDSSYISQDEEVNANPVFAKMFASPVLYSSVVNKGFSGGFDNVGNVPGTQMADDEKRESVINSMMLNVYKNYPSLITLTEEQLRAEKSVAEVDAKDAAPVLEIAANPVTVIPDNVVGGIATTVKKPCYWRTSGSFDMQFTQNYVSPNWSQGGDNTRTMLTVLVLNLNYDDKDKITFTNKFDAHLGFTTVEGDTLHRFKTNNDKLRLESTFGYRLAKNLDLAVKSKLETQLLPNYPTNTPDFVSKFMAPFDANFSLGLNYKPSWKNFSLSIFVAPLSAYNYKFVRYENLASRYGIKQGRHHKEDFGTQFIVEVPSATLFKIVNWWSRAEFYTDYARTFFSWENKFDIKLTRYFKVSMLVHARFDDSSLDLEDDKYGFWQIKEYMTLGLTYSW